MPVLRDETLDRYIDSVGTRLAANAPGPKYPYSFGVVNYKELNAFALPGGPIYVHRGTIAAARTEAQLAGVMAHEVAHVAQRHAAQQISKGVLANGLLGLLGAVLDDGGKGEAAARIGASVLTQSVFMKFSRDDEREADRVGARDHGRARAGIRTGSRSSCRSCSRSSSGRRARSRPFSPRIHRRPAASAICRPW